MSVLLTGLMGLPTYNGIEIDMLSLGNADSILVSEWKNGVVTRVLLDCGNKSDSGNVAAFLKSRGVIKLDHLVVTHPHDDHAGGVRDLIQSNKFQIDRLWMHQPLKHVQRNVLESALGQLGKTKIQEIITESLRTQREIDLVCQQGNIPISEPFQGNTIGFLFVCGPTQSYYEQLLTQFTDLEQLHEFDRQISKYGQRLLIEDVFESTKGESDELGGAPVSPENNSATILYAKFDSHRFLFPSDAGVPALQAVVDEYGQGVANLTWMQIPHHGSRRNLTTELIQHFAPKIANVSADGSKRHPRRAIVNAFKNVGTEVYSTHYPSGQNLWYRQGNVPPRTDYNSLPSLYNAS